MKGKVICLVLSIVIILFSAEMITRLTWKEYVRGLHQVLPDKMHLKANTEGHYKSPDFEFTMKSNRFGKRDWEWTKEVMADPNNVVFIGDSFVMGYGVEDASTVPTLLEKKMEAQGHKREVFNFGLGGAFDEYFLSAKEAVTLGIEAKTIMIGIFVGNDFTEELVYQVAALPQRKSLSVDSFALIRFLKNRISGSPLLTGWIFKIGKIMGKNFYPSSAGYIFLREPEPEQQKQFDSYLNKMKEINAWAKTQNRKNLFVFFPNRIQVENSRELTGNIYDAERPNRLMGEFCNRSELRCVDLLPVLKKQYDENGRPLYFPVDRHLNNEGNEIAAEAILNSMVESA